VPTLKPGTDPGLSLVYNSRVRIARLLPTRVYRFYRGGALLGRLRGEDEEDGPLPEDWVGSVTPASNPGRDEPEAGLSRLADGRLLRDAIAAEPEAWLGWAHLERFGATTGLLVKLLDSAERLPVHAHPTRAFACQHLGSAFGKTEAWIVLATRAAEGEVWVGLREPVPRKIYRGWIERQDTESLLLSLNALTVRAGDVVFVPAGVPHAIGVGVLIAELQEPTDLSLICEWDGFPIRPVDSHLGLGWSRAIEALDLDRHEPVLGLPDEAREFFWADDVVEPAGRFAVLVVTEGEGSLGGEAARAGDAFAVPATAERFEVAGSLRVLRCLSPDGLRGGPSPPLARL
jgi:mannose-6-phosphate isomerase